MLIAKPKHTQNEVNDDRLGLQSIPAEPPEQLSYDSFLFRNADTQFKKPASHPKTKGEKVFFIIT
ncbi:hypothetical protein ASE46_29125 [Bacillus sp. Root239]|nr:hypothetical protein ASE46_29125 [Bacillus sp. Root239]